MVRHHSHFRGQTSHRWYPSNRALAHILVLIHWPAGSSHNRRHWQRFVLHCRRPIASVDPSSVLSCCSTSLCVSICQNVSGLNSAEDQPNLLLSFLQPHLRQMVTTIWHRRCSIWPNRCTGSWTRARTLASSTVWQQWDRVAVVCCPVAMIVMMSCRHRCHPLTIFIDCGNLNDSPSPTNTFF